MEMKKLGELLDVRSGFAFKSKDLSSDDRGIPVIKIGNLVGNEVDYSQTQFVDRNIVNNKISEFFLENKDVLIAMTGQGSVGRVAQLRKNTNDDSLLLNQRVGKFTVNEDVLDNDYLFFILSSKVYQDVLFNAGSGSGQPNLSPTIIKSIEIPYFDIKTQRKISSLLTSLNDKIENNKRINRNLSKQAESIFANEFLDLEEIPEDWEEGTLVDVADYLNGLAMQKFRPENNEQGLPVLKIKELRQGSCDENSDRCSAEIDTKYIVNDGDVIFSWSGSLLIDFWCGDRCGLNQHLFKVTSYKYDKWFYYAWTHYHLDRFIDIAAAKATTMGHIKRKDLSDSKVLIPSSVDYDRIGSLLRPIYETLISNKIENRKLMELRDILLPRLMSGELDVSELDI